MSNIENAKYHSVIDYFYKNSQYFSELPNDLLILNQINIEWDAFIDEVSKHIIMNALEIGSQNGGSLYALSQICQKESKIICIDLFHVNNFLKSFDDRVKLFNSFNESQEMIVMNLDSHEFRFS